MNDMDIKTLGLAIFVLFCGLPIRDLLFPVKRKLSSTVSDCDDEMK